jgi:hypothetical protein
MRASFCLPCAHAAPAGAAITAAPTRTPIHLRSDRIRFPVKSHSMPPIDMAGIDVGGNRAATN